MTDGLRTVTHRVDVLRGGVSSQYTLETMGDTPPSISMVAEGEIPLSMSGAFRRNEYVDYLNDEIRPVLIIDGAEYPLGVYMIGTKTERRAAGGTVYDEIEAYDRCLRMQQTKAESRLYFAAGTAYLTAVQSLLRGGGISMVITDSCDDVLATDRADWEIGTDYLTIVNALLSEINFQNLWFDLNGVARLEKYKAPGGDNIDITYTADACSIIRADYAAELDVFSAPNVFVAMVSNPDYGAAMTATGVNDNPLSALSTLRRGRRILAAPVELDNIATQAALEEYANNLAVRSMLATEKTTFYTALNPVHGVGDVIAIDNGNGLQGVYEETDWTMTLKAGEQMEHKGKRVVVL